MDAELQMTPARSMYWWVQRELWENRSIYAAPLTGAGTVLFSSLLTFPRLRRYRELI